MLHLKINKGFALSVCIKILLVSGVIMSAVYQATGQLSVKVRAISTHRGPLMW